MHTAQGIETYLREISDGQSPCRASGVVDIIRRPTNGVTQAEKRSVSKTKKVIEPLNGDHRRIRRVDDAADAFPNVDESRSGSGGVDARQEVVQGRVHWAR